ncbi:MAG: DUF4923 family protein [Bacteroidia bacterium]
MKTLSLIFLTILFSISTVFAQEIEKKLIEGKWHIKKFDVGSDKNSFKENTKDYYWFNFSDDNTYTSKFLLEESSGNYTFNEDTKALTFDFKNLQDVPLVISQTEDGLFELNGKVGRKKILILLYQ